VGLITGLLKLPAAPLTGTIAVAEQVLRQAEEEYYDPARIRAQLDEVARLREEGALGEDEAEAWEDTLVARLMEGQQRAREGRHG
jgi:chorismate mutase